MNYSEKIYNLPVLPLRGLVIFPKTVLHFDVARKKSKEAVNLAMKDDQLVFLVAQKNPTSQEPNASELYTTGVVAKIIQVVKQPDDFIRVIVEGQSRAFANEYLDNKKCLFAQVVTDDEPESSDSARDVALIRRLKSLFESYTHLSAKLSPDVIFKVALCQNGGELADFLAGNVVLDYRDKQLILETYDITQRLDTLADILTREIYIMQIEQEIDREAKERIDEHQREYVLREQKSIIEEELGEADDPISEAQEYRERIARLKLCEKSEKTLLQECNKLSKMPFGSQEASVIRSYLDTVLELPWNTSTKDCLNLKRISSKLDKNHYGLNKVKERIIESLAVRKLNGNTKGQILCLVGPPGVGKTSIAQSVASAMGRSCVRIALGGVHDEAEIRGHRRTYVGSMPGRIISALKTAGSNNPVLILDEIDKLGSDYKGDPSSALLEVLDSEQNSSFNDHYLDIPFNLSKVFFITTANDPSNIPAPLYDRMEIIQIDSYTREEKLNIAKKHLIPKQLEENGLNSKLLKFTNNGIYTIIDNYTREAGVRLLERTIAKVMRKFAVNYLNNEALSLRITEKNLEEYLGVRKYTPEILSAEDEIGVVNGLAWTSAGGTLLPVEVAVMPGDGKLQLTGSLGDVMQESAKTAVTCIRSHSQLLNIDSDFYKTKDIHIHAPEGAVPKDGPSAGVTMATAIYSALSMRPVRRDIAMTGEITLRGKILPIGGLKEKSMAAYKSGIKTVYIPKDNIPDLEEIDPVIKESVTFIPVEYFTDILKGATYEPVVATDKTHRQQLIMPESITRGSSVRQ